MRAFPKGDFISLSTDAELRELWPPTGLKSFYLQLPFEDGPPPLVDPQLVDYPVPETDAQRRALLDCVRETANTLPFNSSEQFVFTDLLIATIESTDPDGLDAARPRTDLPLPPLSRRHPALPGAFNDYGDPLDTPRKHFSRSSSSSTFPFLRLPRWIDRKKKEKLMNHL